MSNSAENKKRVVVAMSGGVDSSVAAALLVEQGYEVIGMMMRLWSEDGREMDNRCCTPGQMADARRMADQLGIPFYAVDVRDYFKRTIVDFWVNSYAEGDTPNPCIECNRKIRFGFLLDQAMALDADYLATGHYARIKENDGIFELHKGLDETKDQSYVLHVMQQEQLAKVLFPIGDYEKAEVRQLAEKFKLPVAKKSDSMDLCFLGKDTYRNFLDRNAPAIGHAGPILTSAGVELGQHEGLPFYTIGQRKGLGFSAPEPMFVIRKDLANNALIVGKKSELGRNSLTAEKVNWVGQTPTEPIEAEVKIRYQNRPIPATVTPLPDQQVRVEFSDPALGVAAGQGAVFYVGTQCLGGGLIMRPADPSPQNQPTTNLIELRTIS